MRTIRRILLRTFGVIVVLTLIVAAGGYFWLRGSLPLTDGALRIAALSAPVKVLRNSDGIVRIQAENELDLYRALGFVHAQDRLWQMDFTRRIGSGRLSEVMGRVTLPQDRFFRTLGFRQIAEANLAYLTPQTLAALQAYAEGVNGFLATRSGPLPLEFQILRYEPEPWTPADSLLWGRLMALRLSDNWRDELSRARLVGRFSPEQIAELWPAYPEDAPVTLEQSSGLIDRSVAEQLANLLPPTLQPTGASNAWALDGNRSATGSPILANDPHLPLEAPGIWYLARLEAPGITLAGATAPGTPFMLLGHNERIAWGLTTTHSDTQDFFIERIAPDGPDFYVTPEGVEKFKVRDEFIRLPGGESEALVVRQTRHGPVMSDVVSQGSGEAGAVLALSWPALREDDRTADALYAMNHAQDLVEFREALRQFHSPQQNVIYADTAGSIGFMAPARVPVRRSGNGQYPVPGWSGEFDWIGFVPFEELPSRNNPRDGLVINANNKIVPDSYAHLIAVDWPPPYRAERIAQALAGAVGNHGVTESVALQQDIVASAADHILPRLLAAEPASDRARQAAAMLSVWDRQMHRNAPEPLIFQAWIWALGEAILADELGPEYLEYTNGGSYTVQRLIAGDSPWCDNIGTTEIEDCDSQIARALERALDHLSDRFGDDMAAWRWGAAHVARFTHPVLSRLPVAGDFFTYSVEADGGNDTINRATARLGGSAEDRFEAIHGAGLRSVYDLSDLDRSRFMIATGQSGNPLSGTYGNLARRWRDGMTLSLSPDSWALAEQLDLLPSAK
ncbi:MAG: penicillin acylase family protein [Kiloniellaceae bacterium]